MESKRDSKCNFEHRKIKSKNNQINTINWKLIHGNQDWNYR